MKKIFVIITICFLTIDYGQSQQSVEVRLAKVEEGQKNLEKRFDDLRFDMNKRFDDINKRLDEFHANINGRFDDIRGFMLWGFGILFSGMFILVGFILWDRRTTLAPVARNSDQNRSEIEELKRKEKALIDALNKYAETDPKLKEILNKAALF